MIGPRRWARRFRGARISRAFGQACDTRSRHPAWVGLEHEFLVLDDAGQRIDFRTVIHGLALGRADLVPGDRNAYRLRTGSVVTADKKEAEIATAPVELRPGFAERLDAWAAHERAALVSLARPLRLVGDSTHLNVSLPPDVDADRIADLFAARFAAGLMLLMDRPASPGLLIRPRPFRLELGGEYVTGAALRAAAAYAVGATLACVDAFRLRNAANLPPALAVRLERGALRYGWYVDRRAFGVDLYEGGRAAPVVTIGGERTNAQEQLRHGWAAARRHLQSISSLRDLRDADDLVEERAPLPIELSNAEQDGTVARSRRPRSPFGPAVRAWRRPGFELAPVMLTWQTAVFLAASRDHRRAAFVTVPGAGLGSFIDRLRAGDLDDPVEAYLRHPPSGRRLVDRAQVAEPGLYDELGLRAGLLAPERDTSGRIVRYQASNHSVPAGAAGTRVSVLMASATI